MGPSPRQRANTGGWTDTAVPVNGSIGSIITNGTSGERLERLERFNLCMIQKRLLTTGELADALRGVITAATLTRYVREGKLQPAETTPGGHYRWDLDEARDQLRALRPRPE